MWCKITCQEELLLQFAYQQDKCQLGFTKLSILGHIVSLNKIGVPSWTRRMTCTKERVPCSDGSLRARTSIGLPCSKIVNLVRDCNDCQMFAIKNNGYQPLKSVPSHRPFDAVSIDYFGPLPGLHLCARLRRWLLRLHCSTPDSRKK